METKLERIAEVAKTKPKEKFISLAHLINEETIKECHKRMEKGKAAGIDDITKEAYEEKLDSNVKDLISRMKRQSYKPQPVRRVYIPKAGSDKLRPLGIPAYEDKLVQATVAKILNAIFEQDFLECSFGFRPQRSCHDAIKVVNAIVNKKEIKYIVDADIKAFFDNVDHVWLMKFVEYRIADPNILRLIVRFLKSGMMEAGIIYDTPEGTPQGGCISPILANLYLHFVVDLWFEKVIRKNIKGQAYMIRYADDAVFCFEKEEDAKEFYQQLVMRLKKFNLEVSEEKTKIISLGKDEVKDDDDDDDSGTGKSESSFDFLGFTHYVSTNKYGGKTVRRKTSKKKFRASLMRFKEWIRMNRTMPIKILMKKLITKIRGHCNYYGVTGNRNSVNDFIDEIKRLLFKWLNRRSQRKSFNWDKFNMFLKKYPLPKAKASVNIFAINKGKSYVMPMMK
jgi:group II intron reverse transcriptase/maturase